MNSFRFERTVGRRDLIDWGPRLGIDVGLPQPQGAQPSSYTNLSAMIDSGARGSVIVPPKAEAIGLRINNYIKLHRAGGVDERVPVYTAALRLSSPGSGSFFIPKLKLIGCALPGQAADCLLGRDVLSVGSFSHEGTSGLWKFEIPDTRVPPLQMDF